MIRRVIMCVSVYNVISGVSPARKALGFLFCRQSCIFARKNHMKQAIIIVVLAVLAFVGIAKIGRMTQAGNEQVRLPQEPAPITQADKLRMALVFVNSMAPDISFYNSGDVVKYAGEVQTNADLLFSAKNKGNTEAATAFDKLRKAYPKTMRHLRDRWIYKAGGEFWEHDVLIDVRGKNKDRLIIIDRRFAANANILETHRLMEEKANCKNRAAAIR